MTYYSRCLSHLTVLCGLALGIHVWSNRSFAEGGEIEVAAGTTEIFRHELYKAHIEPLRTTSALLVDPYNSIIILLGRDSVSAFLDNPEVQSAVVSGASILIATDRSTSSTQIGLLFGVQVTGQIVTANEEDCLRGLPDRPFVRPYKVWGDIEADSPQTLFQNLDSVGSNALATNVTSVLRITRGGLAADKRALAGFPFSSKVSFLEFDRDRDHFAVGGMLGNGRFLILADHSVFVNGMVWRKDDDDGNLEFTRACIKWLAGKEEKKHCLFVEDGAIKTDFELPTNEDSPWDLLFKALMIAEQHGNELVSEGEKNDLLNRLLLSQIGHGELLRAFRIILTVFVIVTILYLLVRLRSGSDPARTLVTPALAAMIPRGNVLQQRFDSLIATKNVYESARLLVREFMTGIDAEAPGSAPPRITIEEGYEDPQRLRRRITRLWKIGYGDEPVKVAPEEWPALSRDLQEILEDADDGWWKFQPIENLKVPEPHQH